MKRYGILAIVFVFFVLSGIVYLGTITDKMEIDFGEPSFISNNIPPPPVTSIVKSVPAFVEKITTFDCAKTYDEWRDIYYKNWNPTLSINYLKNENLQVRIAMIEQEDKLLENSCFINVEKWAYKSKYEEEVWDGWESGVQFNINYHDGVYSQSDLVNRAMNYYKMKPDGTACDDDRRWVEDRGSCIRMDTAEKIFYGWDLEWLRDHPEMD